MRPWFDDPTVGRSWRSPSRTVTEADVGDFAGLTGDHFPLHTSEEYAKGTQFGTRIAHGLLGLTFAQRLIWARTGELDDSMIAFLGVRDRQFLAPIHFRDTIRVDYEVIDQRASASKPDSGIVDFQVQVSNQHDDVIQQGVNSLLVAKETK
ncbi:MaoC/PaaZ C-terminal domain-containing protein [Rhodococcus sp. NPDC057014]|uniref:MaoC/PaaZ C-terminal domain-containing protein n=1 Tax=Rhodococcus sp. NPDC057014 TaxID=3346000 RepID=UPI0036357816